MENKDEKQPEPTGATSRPLTPDEFAALSKDMNDVLIKHGADMAVVATISMTKRLENNGQTPGTTEEASKVDKEA